MKVRELGARVVRKCGKTPTPRHAGSLCQAPHIGPTNLAHLLAAPPTLWKGAVPGRSGFPRSLLCAPFELGKRGRPVMGRLLEFVGSNRPLLVGRIGRGACFPSALLNFCGKVAEGNGECEQALEVWIIACNTASTEKIVEDFHDFPSLCGRCNTPAAPRQTAGLGQHQLLR